MPPAAKDRIASTEVVLPVKQSEIYVYVPASNVSAATGGGLIGALVDVGVDAVRTSKAEDAVKPLRASMSDYSFDRVMQSDMQHALANLAWLHTDNVHVLKEVSDETMDRALAASKDSAVLFASADYQLSNDADVLTVTMNAGLFPNSDALRALKQGKTSSTKTALANSLYHNKISFEYRAPNATSDRDANIAHWSADNGAAMRRALDTSLAKLAWLLTQDLQSAMASPAGAIPNTDAHGTVSRAEDGTLKFTAASVAQ
jgi:hypothetical protein